MAFAALSAPEQTRHLGGLCVAVFTIHEGHPTRCAIRHTAVGYGSGTVFRFCTSPSP